jgi:hypothetical protein
MPYETQYMKVKDKESRTYLEQRKGNSTVRKAIDEIKYLPRMIMVAYLSGNLLVIADGINLTSVQEFS